MLFLFERVVCAIDKNEGEEACFLSLVESVCVND